MTTVRTLHDLLTIDSAPADPVPPAHPDLPPGLQAAIDTLDATLDKSRRSVAHTPGSLMQALPEFAAPSWSRWKEIVSQVNKATREVWIICGRGAGKSRVTSIIAAAWASRRYKIVPGEKIFVQVIASDRKQAKITFSYISGLIQEHPDIFPKVERALIESIELENGVVIEVGTASIAAPRGRSYACVLVEEAAFLAQDGANPDTEILRALRPGLARVPGSILCVLSSPYARKGELYRAYEKYHEGAPDNVVFVKAPTLELNPSFDREEVERALAEDPAGARAEYLAEFRTDVESFVTIEAVRACLVPGRTELLPAGIQDKKATTYHGFVDPSGGSQDSFTAAIAHEEERDGGVKVAVLDAVREVTPPFSPESVVAEFCELFREYGVRKVSGDRYGGEWPREVFQRHGVTYETASRTKSDIYRDWLPLVNARRVELLDNRRLVDQAVGLERRTSRGGRDTIDHGPGGHDDLVNVVAGVCVEMLTAKRGFSPVWGMERRN